MSSYSTIDYLSDLTFSKMSNAIILNFSPYSVASIGWDYRANVFGSESYAILHDIYSFTAKEGAIYDIFSTSYFDPFILLIYDQFGNVIVANNESDDGSDVNLGDAYYGQDIIFDWVAPYSGTYYVSASWNQGSYYKYYSLSIYEDRDTIIQDTLPPTIALTSSETTIGADGTATITFILSESSADFTLNDIEVTGGTISNFIGSASSYSALFTPFLNSATLGFVRVANSKFSDNAGNFNNDENDVNNSVSIIINNVSSDVISTATHTVDILVNQGVLSNEPVLLKGLTENINYLNNIESNRTITYNHSVYDLSLINSFITIIVRDGNFTENFSKEITDFAPSVSNITYNDAVLLVGIQSIDSVLIKIAGADGNYIY